MLSLFLSLPPLDGSVLSDHRLMQSFGRRYHVIWISYVYCLLFVCKHISGSKKKWETQKNGLIYSQYIFSEKLSNASGSH